MFYINNSINQTKLVVHKFLWLVLATVLLVFWSLSNIEVNAASNSELVDSEITFEWDNATVYFVLTDRFLDGDSSNNHAYGRELDQNGNPYPDYQNKVATYHGGDFQGLTDKVNEGYFTSLGVNAVWITQPFEQANGWIGGEGFRHYPFHGYYAQDYTEVDDNLGSEDDLKTFIDTAHEHGIRVVFDIVMNHPGYESMKDMNDHNFGELNAGWEDYYYNRSESEAHYDTYDNYLNTNSSDWQDWWGPDWVRKDGLLGYDQGGSDDKTLSLAGLPDFKTESTQHVEVPTFLQEKWGPEKTAEEKAELQAFFNRTGKQPTVRNHLIKWITDWVREYGIDGFRVDTAKHVQLEAWDELKVESNIALQEWKDNNPDKKLDDNDFWMTGEVWGHGVGKSEYFDNGFDSVINFDFQKSLQPNLSNLEAIYSDYANKINSDPDFNVLSYISSHDTTLFDRSNMINGGTGLLLAPGAVQIFYGDEVQRKWMDAPWDDMKSRSSMDWNNLNDQVLAHWQKIGQFRNNHLAIGAGQHKQIQSSPYAFSRTYNDDKVVVAVGANDSTTINVSSVFSDGTSVRDFYTGDTSTVSNGQVTFDADANGVILIEQAEPATPIPSVAASFTSAEFDAETMDVTLKVTNTTEGKYTIDGSDPKTNGISFENGDVVTIGNSLVVGESITIELFAENEYGTAADSYTFTKVKEKEGITVHFKQPVEWGTPQVYYYETEPAVDEPTWITSPSMESDGNSWHTYTIKDVNLARVIFKDDQGNQTPGQSEAGYLRNSEGWFMNGNWYDENPEPEDNEAPSVPTGLTNTAKTASSVSLSWNASTDNYEGPVEYEIYQDGDYIGVSSETNYKITGLAESTAYEFSLLAVDSSKNKSDKTESLLVTTSDEAQGNTATIYYKKGFSNPYIHYAVNSEWTDVPGIAMNDSTSYPGYATITIDLGDESTLTAVFNNGNGNWDNNNGQNYVFAAGESTFGNGTISEGEPQSND